MMGADGPGKAEVAIAELVRADLFCDDWEQASHGGELAAAVEAGVVTRDRVTDIGLVLTGEAEGRRSGRDITLFDSTGLAIQDLAIAKVAAAKADHFRPAAARSLAHATRTFDPDQLGVVAWNTVMLTGRRNGSVSSGTRSAASRASGSA